MEIVAARLSDIPQAVDCLVLAFADDELMQYFFAGEVDRRSADIREFLSILMTVRVELGLPTMLLQDARQIVGAVMGYDTSRPEWPRAQSDRWVVFVSSRDGLSGQFDAYENIAKRFEPQHPHFYLGVLGVRPGRQGIGAGLRLIEAYCDLSDADPHSTGTYLETAEQKNVQFYQSCGFDLVGSGDLGDDVKLFCLFRQKRGTKLPPHP